jgi:hypothetical protein
VVGRTPKLFFGAKARPTTGPWQYLYPPGLLLHSREQDENGHSTLTVRSYPPTRLLHSVSREPAQRWSMTRQAA